MSYPPPQPGQPARDYNSPPAHPTPPTPPAKRNNAKLLLGIAGGFLALCCGGVTIAAITSDDPTPVPPATATPAAQIDATNTRGVVGATPARGPSTTATTKPRTKAPTKTRTSPAPKRTTATPKRTTAKPKPAKTADKPKAVYYENCAAVRAAGAAPIRRGDPGYAKHLDRDGDGQGCGDD